MRRRTLLTATVSAPLALVGCGAAAGAARTSSRDASAADPMTMRLAHNLSGTHPTSRAIASFAEDVAARSEGRLRITIFGDGQLGSEDAVRGQLSQGILDMTRMASPGLAPSAGQYHTFGLPYVFTSEEDMHAVLDSDRIRDFYRSTEADGFVGLTHYTSGSRSFYTRATAIREPADLDGSKIRVQDIASQTQLLELLGGAPVVMSLGDVYTALQTGLIDGAESNETALTTSNHGEVAKVYSRTEHTRIPDVLMISAATWQRLDATDRELVTDAAVASSKDHRVAWATAIEEATARATEMGVEFVDDVDLEAFRAATAPLTERFARERPEVADMLSIIDQARAEVSA